jgi:hypothetical protein
MSEKLNLDAGQFEILLKAPEQHKTLPTAEQAEPLRPGEEDPLQKLHKARHEVSQASRHNKPVERPGTAEKSPQPATHTYINRELKSITLRRELKLIQRKLPAAQRTLSKVIHQPIVRAISEGTGKTLTRPSGLLGGGITAFIGSSAYLYLANHLGFAYNYGVFLVLFAGGFVLGVLLETAVHLATASKRRHD